MYITFSEEDCGESFDEVIRCMYRDICVIMTYRHYNSRTGYVADGSVERKDLGYCFSVYLVFVMTGFYFDVTGLANGFLVFFGFFIYVVGFGFSVISFLYFLGFISFLTKVSQRCFLFFLCFIFSLIFLFFLGLDVLVATGSGVTNFRFGDFVPKRHSMSGF